MAASLLRPDFGQVRSAVDWPSTKAIVLPLALTIVLLAACSSSTSENPAAGKRIFAANCAVCHGTEGQGQPDWHIPKEDGTLPPPPLNGDGHTWHHSDGLLYRIVSQGGQFQEDTDLSSFRSAMPAFGDQLSREEIVQVLTYVKSLWGDKTSRGSSIKEWQALASETDPFPK